MDAAVIINPAAAGCSRAALGRRVALAREVLRACDRDGEVMVTTRPGHGRELAGRAIDRGVDTIVSWGGDGSMNEVASELAFGGPALGLVPGGSGNGLARELNVPWNPRLALRTALTGTERRIDAGEIGGRLFFNVAGLGFDAHIAAQFNALRVRGGARYVAATVRDVWSYQPRVYNLRSPDLAIRTPALLVVLANAGQYGLNARIAPRARPDDGQLELVVVPPLPPLSILWHARRLFTGTVSRLPGVTMQATRGLEITSEALAGFHVDGETVEAAGTLTARIHPRALRVRVGPRAG